MRTVLALAVASLLIAPCGFAQRGGRGGGGPGGGAPAQPPPPANPGLECFDKLEDAEFPAAALSAHIDGSVWTWAQLNQQGTIEKVDSQVVSAYGQGPKLLVPPVEKALRASKFKSSCAGKTVAVVFRFQLHGDAVAAPKPTVKQEPPNIVNIESQPAKAAAPASAKAAPATKGGAK
jgi:hypothetical protein